MVNLTDKMRIVQMHLSGKSNRDIAAGLGLNRKTVDKRASRYEAALAVMTADGAPRTRCGPHRRGKAPGRLPRKI